MKQLLITAIFFLSIFSNKISAQCTINWNGKTCTGSQLEFTGPLGGSTYDWTFEDASGSKSNINGQRTIKYIFNKSGTSKISCISTINGSKCTSNISLNILSKPSIKLKLTTPKIQCFEKNIFCFRDSSSNSNGSKISSIQYRIISNRWGYTVQSFYYDFPPAILPNTLCFSIKDIRGGKFDFFIETTDNNGCQDTQLLTAAIEVRAKIGAQFTSNKPVACDSVQANYQMSFIDSNYVKVKKSTWYWGDGSMDTTWGRNKSHWFNKQGTFNTQLIIQTIYGCVDSFNMKAAAMVFRSKAIILADKDSTCISAPNIKFRVNEIPSGATALWNFGDPNSGPQNTNSKSWTPEHAFTGLGPFLVKLDYKHPICGNKVTYDTIIVLGPSSGIESSFQRVADYETFQCPKDVMDTVHFKKNLSSFYHNDRNYTDDDSNFYKWGTRALGHVFQGTSKTPTQIWMKPVRMDANLNGTVTKYTGTASPGGGFDPLKRERICATRLWDFGDNYAPKCTTDTRENKNVYVNCAYSRDSIPNHYYRSWDLVLLSNFKNTSMQDAIFLDTGIFKGKSICKTVQVWPSDSMYIIQDTLIVVPTNSNDVTMANKAQFVGNKTTTYYNYGQYTPALPTSAKNPTGRTTQKGMRGIGQRYFEDWVDVKLDAGDSAWTGPALGPFVLQKGPKTISMSPKQILKLRSKSDSCTWLFTYYIKTDTLPKDLYLIRKAKGEKPKIIKRFKKDHTNGGALVRNRDFFVNYKRFRELYYAKIPQCNNVKLNHKDTCHPMRCESEAIKQLSMLHANAGGVGSGMLKDAIECLGSNNPSYGVTFILSDLKPGCTFTEVKINYDTFCGNASGNWSSLNSLFPGGRPLSPPAPYWNTGYQLTGNPSNKFSNVYNTNDVCGKNGCVTVGIIVGNGIAAPGGNSGTRPLCADTQYYDNFACFPKLDANFEIVNLKKNKLGDYKICKNNAIVVSPAINNKSVVKDIKSIRYQLSSGDASPKYSKETHYYIQEDYYQNQIKVPGKNPNYLYNYLVVTRTSQNPKPLACSEDWVDGEITLVKKPDTIYTAEIKKFKLGVNIAAVWEIMKTRLEARGFDPFAVADTQIVKMIWNGKGIIGNPSSGAFGCLDTTGFGNFLKYYYLPDVTSKTILHFRDTSIRPVDLVTYFDPITKKTKSNNAYKFTPKWSGFYIVAMNITSKSGYCDALNAFPVIVGFSNNLKFTDSIVPQRFGNSLTASPDFRYFSTEPQNYGQWDWKYQWNSDPTQNPTGYDYWRDPKRSARLATGDTNVEKSTRWDWNKADDKTSTPFGGAPYGANGAGTNVNPWKQLGGGGPYYNNDTGVYTFRMVSSDSTGCMDTVTKRIFVTRVKATINLKESYTSCKNVIEINDQSKILDPCNWAMKTCNNAMASCDFINKWVINWGDSTKDEFIRNSETETGVPINLKHSYKANGLFKITYNVYTKRGDYDSISQNINIRGSRPKFEFTDSRDNEITICQGKSVSFTNMSDSASKQARWTWDFGDGSNYIGPDSTWYTKAPNGKPYAANYFVDTVVHQFNKVGEFYIQLEQTEQFKFPTNQSQTCSAIYPGNQGSVFYKVIVNPNDTIRGTISKSHINPGDTISFIDLSNSNFDTYKWKFRHFSKSLNKYIVDSIITTSKIINLPFSDTGIYTVEHSAWNSNNFIYCVINNSNFNFKVDNSKIGINQLTRNKFVSISPNPVKDYLRIKISKNIKDNQYFILDFAGRMVKNGQISNTLDVSNLASGSYFIVIDNTALIFVKTQ